MPAKILVTDLAGYCGICARSLERYFGEYYGMSVAKYIMQLKLKEAGVSACKYGYEPG